MRALFQNIMRDLPASIVVFFVAVPLCLGIALASGAPLFAGIIAGIVGGIVVGAASGSALGVSGPAAGLTVIVSSAIVTLGGSWEAFLLAVVFAGVIQIVAGYLGLGIIAYYFPSSVIKGMLTGIGLLIILKQIPHAIGYNISAEGELAFQEVNGHNTFTGIFDAISFATPGAVLTAVVALTILLVWDCFLSKRHRIFGIINGPLVAVLSGIVLNYLFQIGAIPFVLDKTQIVQIPVATSIGGFLSQFVTPDFSQIFNVQVYLIALVLASIASIETLLCVEATDKLDPEKRVTPTNRELKAQGFGNVVSGLIGGLPLTQVIVRSSANIAFGGRTKLSAIMHGFFILISAVLFPQLLNMIPLSTLAAILFVVGYKLAKPALFKQIYKQGWEQFVPFAATVLAILLTDLLRGIGIGMIFAIFYLLRNNFRNPFYSVKRSDGHGEEYLINLAEEVSFLNKGRIMQTLNEVASNSKVIIDGTKSTSIHHDVIEIIEDFVVHAKTLNIVVELKGSLLNKI